MKNRPTEKSKSKTKKIEFKLYAPQAQRVALAGDFNNWGVDNLPMKKDNKGTWEASFGSTRWKI